VRFECPLDDGGKADDALFDRQGRALAVIEAKSSSVDLNSGEAQGRGYAKQLAVSFVFQSNGDEISFCDTGQDAHFHRVETVLLHPTLRILSMSRRMPKPRAPLSRPKFLS
jgi:type I restriction enzyme R subunit